MNFTLVNSKDRPGKQYKVTDSGTAYHLETPGHLVELLERLRQNGTRITIDFGDVNTGKSWEEEYDITGRIGRSTGSIKIPLLVHNARSYGGGALLDHCILSIKHSNKKDGGILYEAPVLRLEYLRQELRAERISYGELAELQSLSDYIQAGDVELAEAAGIPEEEFAGRGI